MGGKQGQIQTDNDGVQILSAGVEESRPDAELKTLSPNFFWMQIWEKKVTLVRSHKEGAGISYAVVTPNNNMDIGRVKLKLE